MDLKDRLLGKDIKIHAYGVNSGTSLLNLNDFAVNQVLPAFMGAGFKLDITSSDNTKDVAAGTGAKKVKVYGLGVGYVPLVEEIALNGQTAVTTVNTFLRVFAVAVSLVGTDGVQAGDIYIIKTGSSTWAAGVPNTLTAASVICKILIAQGVGYTGYWTVPADKTDVNGTAQNVRKAKLMSITPSGGIQNARLLIQAQPNLDTDNAMATVWETVVAGLTAGAAGWIELIDMQEDFDAGTDIVLKVIPLVAGGSISAQLHIRYV